jgi:5-methylcytosine-specific restriction protein A
VPEWIGATDNQPPPDRVRLRVLTAYGRRCGACGLPITGRAWTCDHIKALINGGENRESNLQPLGNKCCLMKKNQADVAEKAASYKTRKSHNLSRKPKGRPLPGTKASGIRKRMDGKVERW